jgi:hypothetical protein
MNTWKFYKLIILILTTIIVGCGCGKNEIGSDLESSGLKGRVKEYRIKEWNVNERFGNIEKLNIESDWLYKYNKRGMMTEKVHYDEDGDISYHLTFEYIDGQYMSNGQILINKMDKSKYKGVKYVWDGNRNLVSKTDLSKRFNDDIRYFYTYDDKGRLICEEEFDYHDDVVGKIDYKYDNNRLSEKVLYFKNGKINDITKYEYSSKGDILSEKRYNSDGESFYGFENKYDNKGEMIESISFGYDGGIESKTIFSKVSKGYMKQIEEFDSGGDVNETSTILLDHQENWIEIIKRDWDGDILNQSTRQYEYDDKMNIIRLIERENNEISLYQETEIEYY